MDRGQEEGGRRDVEYDLSMIPQSNGAMTGAHMALCISRGSSSWVSSQLEPYSWGLYEGS